MIPENVNKDLKVKIILIMLRLRGRIFLLFEVQGVRFLMAKTVGCKFSDVIVQSACLFTRI